MKAVILAGGAGNRLWPLSSPQKPKQFQKLTSEHTMLEQTVNRLNFLPPEDIYIATNKEHVELCHELCPQIPAENIIIEPDLRDTASAIGLCAAIIHQKDPQAVMSIIYADHLIQNEEEFQKKLTLAAEIAATENTLNIVEVIAEEPNTNYGYVKLDQEIQPDVFMLDSFTEKPDFETAKKFLQSGKYLWNTGIYVWKTETILQAYKEQQPETYQKLIEMAENEQKIPTIYPTLPKISIDYAIMEKVDPQQVRIIKADLNWSDIGNWEALHSELVETKPSDQNRNIFRGKDVKTKNCQDCLIYGETDQPIKALGLQDIVIVNTKEGLLVAHKSQAKEIKKLL